jgi:hypothetical protein
MTSLALEGFSRRAIVHWLRNRLVYETGRKYSKLTVDEVLEKYNVSFMDFTLMTKDNVIPEHIELDWHPPLNLYVSIGAKKGECPVCRYVKVLDVRKKVCFSCFSHDNFDAEPGLKAADGYLLTKEERKRLDEVRSARTPPIPIPVFDDNGKVKKVDLS